MRKHLKVIWNLTHILKLSIEESSFTKIYLSSKKIFFLNKSNFIFVGIFDVNTNGSLIKLYLLHVYAAFLNFLGDNIDLISKNKKREELGVLIQTGTEGGPIHISKDYLQIKIFEVILS